MNSQLEHRKGCGEYRLNGNSFQMLQPGDKFGRYEVVQVLSRRPFSQIYRAVDSALERTVALKAFEDIRDEPTIARIQREAILCSKIAHPNIVRLYDVLTQSRSIYFVLEFVEGQTLGDVLKSEQLNLKQILTWQVSILSVLTYLHSEKIIHRDVKPSNILIRSTDQKLVLSDFGTSKTIEADDETTADDEITIAGSLVGTLLYAAPEQIMGEAVTPVVDVYSSGAVFYEMLTGQLLFRGPGRPLNPERIDEIAAEWSGIPSGLVDLIKRMTSADPSARPSSNLALETLRKIISEHDLEHIRDLRPIRTKTMPPPELSRAPTGETTLMATVMTNAPSARPTGFFVDQALRVNAYNQSVNFFRSHLDSDYKNLLNQAKLAFALWLGCAAVAFGILVAGVVLLFRGDATNGAITLASDVLVLFIQKIFKDREEYYRDQANQKHAHLQMGNAWSLAVQSLDGISDSILREQKLGALSDALIQAFGGEMFVPQNTHSLTKIGSHKRRIGKNA